MLTSCGALLVKKCPRKACDAWPCCFLAIITVCQRSGGRHWRSRFWVGFVNTVVLSCQRSPVLGHERGGRGSAAPDLVLSRRLCLLSLVVVRCVYTHWARTQRVCGQLAEEVNKDGLCHGSRACSITPTHSPQQQTAEWTRRPLKLPITGMAL